MHAWEQIDLTINYIENNLAEEISIQKLSKKASLSPFYFQRLFKRLVKTTVNDYIKRRRLAKSSELLREDNKKRILDIALEVGFSSHEVFTRTFKETFGITPENFRKNPIRLNQYNKPELLLNYTLVDENVPLITNGVVFEISREKIDKAKTFIGFSLEEEIDKMPTGKESESDQSLGKLWDNFHIEKQNIKEAKQNGDEIGVTMMASEEGYYKYFVGIEAINEKEVMNYETFEIPKGEYIVCTFEAESFEHLIMDALYKVHSYLYNVWLPNNKIITDMFSIEYYKKHNMEIAKMEVMVKIIENN